MTRLTHMLALACIITPFTIYGMVDARLSIATKYQTTYATKDIHKFLAKECDITSTNIKDPLIFCNITDKNSYYTSMTLVPVKNLIFCADGSTIQLHNGSTQNPIYVNALCTREQDNTGSSFSEQFDTSLQESFAHPPIPYGKEKNRKQLENDKIITSQHILVTTFIPSHITGHSIPVSSYQAKYAPGENGSTSKEDIIRSILHEKISPNMNAFTALANRELKGSFK